MVWSSIGDLSQSYLLARNNTALKAESNALQTEMSTGQAHNTRGHLGGDYSYLADVERNLTLLGSYRNSISEATIVTDAIQSTLQNVQTSSSDLASQLILASQSGSQSGIDVAAAEARHAFLSMADNLNLRIGDRSAFAGAAFDQAALADGETILGDLRSALSGQNTLGGVQSVLDDWFDTPGGGFETSAYFGSSEDAAPFKLSEGTSLEIGIKADNVVFKELLKGAAMAALADDETLGFAETLQVQLVETAGNKLLADQPAIIDLQADVGTIQGLIEERSSQNEAADAAMQIARNELLSVDQYEAATRLEAAQNQIEILYAITARAQQLSFLDYMR